MKKLIAALVVLLTLISCESDVKFNDPSFQGQKNNVLWRADVTTAIISNGNLTINGYRGLEIVTLVVPAPTAPISNANAVTYELGTDDVMSDAIFAAYSYTENGVSLDYATAKGEGNGEIVINEYNPTTKKLSGTFRFNAAYQGDNDLVPTNLNFLSGFIYRIQVQ